MKSKFVCVCSMLCCLLSFNISVFADDSEVTSDTTITSEVTSSESTTTTTTTIGASFLDVDVNVNVESDNIFTSLEKLLKFYSTDLDSTAKALLTKACTNLIVSVVMGVESYTLETFIDAFVQIFEEFSITVTDDVIDAITKFACWYLEDDLEVDNNDSDVYLLMIASNTSFLVTLYLISQLGGVRRGW